VNHRTTLSPSPNSNLRELQPDWLDRENGSKHVAHRLGREEERALREAQGDDYTETSDENANATSVKLTLRENPTNAAGQASDETKVRQRGVPID